MMIAPKVALYVSFFMIFLQLLFPDFFLIALGYVLCRLTPLDERVWQGVEALVYYVLFPVLLFHSIVKNPLNWSDSWLLVAGGLTCAVATIALAYSLPKLPLIGRRIPQREHACSAQIAFRFNSFIGLALADRLLGAQGLVLISVLIGLCVPLFNIAAVWPMARGSGAALVIRQLLRNPLIIATLSGLCFSLLGWELTSLLQAPAQRLGASSIALGLMSAGAGLRLGMLWSTPTLSATLLGIRHLIAPVLALGVAFILNLPHEQKLVLLLFNALPTSSTCYVLATRMGYAGSSASYVAGLISLSTALGALSLPLAILWSG